MTGGASRCCRRRNPWVDFDPVVSHLGMHHLASGFRHDDISFLGRHVAVNALAYCPGLSKLFGRATALPLMAGEAFRRIGSGGLSGGVHVVAGCATQFL